MKTIVKQVVGIDVAQKELVVRLGRMYEELTPQMYASKAFANTISGYGALVKWVNKLMDVEVPIRYVMEATGVYHESLAYFLDEKGHELSIVLPNKISNYIRTLERKTITDQTAADAIAQFGLERKLACWKKPKKIYKNLRQLTRERNQLIEMRTICKNQLHAEKAEAEPHHRSIDRFQKRIQLLDKQVDEVQAEIKDIIKPDPEVSQTVALLCSITGVGLLTAATVLGETDGFALIRNKRQLASYAGLDVVEKQSGTSVKGKPRISKKGNKYLRKAMHLPALAAIRNDQRYKNTFVRLVSKHGIKMKAAVAVQRKLLEMIFTVYKKQQKYERTYFENPEQEEKVETNEKI